MRDDGYQSNLNLCIFCHVSVPRPALCTIKLGTRWAQVRIFVNAESTHSRELDMQEIDDKGISIVFEMDNVVRYHPTEMIQLHDIGLARIIRWFHRMLKCVLFNLFDTDAVYASRVMSVLKRVTRMMTWEPQDRGFLFRLL